MTLAIMASGRPRLSHGDALDRVRDGEQNLRVLGRTDALPFGEELLLQAAEPAQLGNDISAGGESRSSAAWRT